MMRLPNRIIPKGRGCDEAEGECAYNEATEPGPWISVTEVRCNLLFDGVMQPDVDSDGDGENDLISLGIRVDAVHATVNTLQTPAKRTLKSPVSKQLEMSGR